MSSSYVRTEIKGFLAANSAETVIDLTGQFLTMKEVIANAGIGRNDDWVGIQFIGSNEDPQTLTSTNTTGFGS